MLHEEIMEKMTDIFKKMFNNENITLHDKTGYSDIEGWDSLMQINIIAAIGKQFSIKFTMEEITSMRDVGKMVEVIERKWMK